MKYEDLHPLLRWWYRKERDTFTPERCRQFEQVWGRLQKGELPWFVYGSVLAGFAVPVFIAAFNLWTYSALVIGIVVCAAELIYRHKWRGQD